MTGLQRGEQSLWRCQGGIRTFRLFAEGKVEGQEDVAGWRDELLEGGRADNDVG